LFAPRALAHDAIRTALGQRSRSVSYGFVAQAPGVLSAGPRGSSADRLYWRVGPRNWRRLIMRFIIDG
jgi:hypothetical protein